MKRLTLNIFFTALPLLLCACNGSDDGNIPPPLANLDADFPLITPLADTLEQTLDDYLLLNQADDAAGTAILVRKDGDVVYQKSKGMADINNGIPVDDNTGFHLGSLSKSFTALAVMQLQERGQLALSDSIRDYMPEFHNSWQAITIEQLLSHRAGLYDYLADVGSNIGYIDMTNQKIIDYFVEHPQLKYSPGSSAEYVNTGYLFLAEIVSRVSGMSFSVYMQTQIFFPARMDDSYIRDELNPLRAGDALNYGDRDTWFNTYHYTYGASGQVSSIDDLKHFIDALFDGSIVSPASIELMTQVHSIVNARGYGYGVTVDGEVDGEARISHGGSHDGYRSILLIDAASELAYVILACNGDRSAADQFNLRSLIESFYGIN